ncbi:hypothetical protein [Thalassospira sp.]|uniref:hypothetical protein n=1 Tax=Thalassospira sp. TaxID=1912094 RepID=UPI00257E711B|nr:hypothetical protein [Thalassospira sp.]|tara:strand:- start:415 stop:669 length:255 start_codon:yes stop_codon:yes gene_type:complete
MLGRFLLFRYNGINTVVSDLPYQRFSKRVNFVLLNNTGTNRFAYGKIACKPDTPSPGVIEETQRRQTVGSISRKHEPTFRHHKS